MDIVTNSKFDNANYEEQLITYNDTMIKYRSEWMGGFLADIISSLYKIRQTYIERV